MDLRGPLLKLFSCIANPYHTPPMEVVISFFVVALLIFMVFPVREAAKGYVAKILGDDTAEREGRITLNPFNHIDITGIFLMLIIPIGFVKPININPSRFRKVSARTGVILTSLTGSVTCIIAAYILLVILKLIILTTPESAVLSPYLLMAFQYAILINLFLAVLNMLPIPPFDGGKILFLFLRAKWHFLFMRYQNMINLVVIVLIFSGVLDPIFSLFTGILYSMLDFLSGFLG